MNEASACLPGMVLREKEKLPTSTRDASGACQRVEVLVRMGQAVVNNKHGHTCLGERWSLHCESLASIGDMALFFGRARSDPCLGIHTSNVYKCFLHIVN